MQGIRLAFVDFDFRAGIWNSPLAGYFGFAHFREIFLTPAFRDAVITTVWLNVLALLVAFPAPIIFALLINEIKGRLFAKGFKRLVQTISYLPFFLSWIAITGLSITMLSPYGVINDVLFRMGIEPIRFLENRGTFVPLYLFLVVWRGVGWGSIIFLASMAAISTELYEAATLDGANRFKQAWHITLPSIMPTTMILLILQLGQLFGSNFELVFGLQNPFMDFDVIATVVYRHGLLEGNQEIATALGLFQGAVALLLTFGANAISRKVSEVSLW